MALFGNLFEKKICDVCGNEIGLLGNRKLADGNLCKDCAGKLSPFFYERKESTIEEIKQQLAYREQNKAALPDLRPDEIYGTKMKIYVDNENRKFIVTRNNEWRSGNPDIIGFEQVQSVENKVRENKEEIYKKTEDGKRESYDPKRYKKDYSFITKISVNSPYISSITVDLSEGDEPVNHYEKKYKDYEAMMEKLRCRLLMIETGNDEPEVKEEAPAADEWKCTACGAVNTGKFCSECGSPKPEVKLIKFCPNCGAAVSDPANPPKFCSNCGGALK